MCGGLCFGIQGFTIRKMWFCALRMYHVKQLETYKPRNLQTILLFLRKFFRSVRVYNIKQRHKDCPSAGKIGGGALLYSY